MIGIDKLHVLSPEVKSTGSLIDELVTADLHCWHAQEQVMRGGADSEMATAAVRAQQMNARRNALIRAIDSRLGEASVLEKTYD